MEIHCFMTLFYQSTALAHSFVLETSLNQHWWFISLEISHGVIHQHFLPASTLSSELHKNLTGRGPKDHVLHPNLQGYREITSAFDKQFVQWGWSYGQVAKIRAWEQYSLNIIVCLLGNSAVINNFSLVSADWKICTFTYLCKSSCLQMPWSHHSKDICILLGCLYTALHHRC